MTIHKGAYCPEWCVETHHVKDAEDAFIIHWKGFGTVADDDVSLIRVWVAYEGDQKYSAGAEVGVLTTYSSDDIRNLSADCLQAADWMDKHLQSISQSA